MRNFSFFLIFIAVVVTTSLSAQTLQTAPSGPREDGNIEEQLDYLILKENNYKTYKVIPRVKMDRFKTSVMDTLAQIRKNLQTANNTLSERNTTITSLNKNITTLQSNLDATNTEKNSISFFGMNMSKGGYKTLMWLIIGGLATLLGMFIFRFRQSNVDTVQTKKDLEDLQKEFEEHRKRSLEREQKAMRKLQDEINRKGGA